jgi:cell division protein FtsB
VRKLNISKIEFHSIKSKEYLKQEQQLDKRDQQYQELKTDKNELKETVNNLMKFAREYPERFVKYVNK